MSTEPRVIMTDPSGSAAPYIHNLANALTDAGCQVDLYTGPYWMNTIGKLKQHIYSAHVFFYKNSQLRAYAARGTTFSGFWKVIRLVSHIFGMTRLLFRCREADLVHIQFLPVPTFDLLWMKITKRMRPVVLTVHDLLPPEADAVGVGHGVWSEIYHTAGKLIVHAKCTAKGLQEEFGVAPEKIVHIPHPAMEHLQGLATEQPDASSVPRILFFGQLRANKGLDVLLDAIAELKRKEVNVKLLVAGASRVDVEIYEVQAQRLQLQDTVEFRWGLVSEREAAGMFLNATLIVLPYRRIDQSGVALAACALGRAIVASRVGGLEELIEEAGCGALVPPNEPVALADAIERVLSTLELRRTYEENGKRYANTIASPSEMAKKTLEVYREVCGGDTRGEISISNEQK
jgi:glycosyltransferase involved in cell wall biosynthesis